MWLITAIINTQHNGGLVIIDYALHLLEIHWGYYVIAILLTAMLSVATKRLSLGLLAGYSWIVLAVTVLSRTPTSVSTYELQLFWSYSIPSLRDQIILNIISFIPIGFLGAVVWNGRVKMWGLMTLLYGIGLSTAIELMQLFSHRGLFEFDDILDNGIGTLVGVLILMVVRWIVEMMRCTGRVILAASKR